MLTAKMILYLLLGGTALWFLWAWRRLAIRGRHEELDSVGRAHRLYHSVIAFVLCFFDTLGIGNFAPTTSAFKFRGSVPDEKIPGTLNLGYALPTVAQAFIYISIVEVDFWTMALLILASVLGAWLGAGFVAKWPRRKVQIGMGCALLVAGIIFVMQIIAKQKGVPEYLVSHFPSSQSLVSAIQSVFAGGEQKGLSGLLLLVGFVGNFLLGALMTLGIGLYAPCLMMISLLGMNPDTAFPIMMGSCAFLMPIGGIRFVREGSYSLSTMIVMSLFGIPGVLLAAFVFTKLSITYLRWLVVVVVIYAAVLMLRSAWKERNPQRSSELDPEPASD